MLEAFIDTSSNKGPLMPTPVHASRTLLLACDSKNTVLAETAGSIHHLAYSPYGQQSSRQEVMTRLGFNGELREAKTDWYFLGKGYRVYNPCLMRFHSYDKFSPFGKGGLNGFAYCGGEPVMRADPSGEGWFNIFADFWGLFSPVGTSGGSVGRTTTVAKPQANGGILVAMASTVQNAKRTYPKAINKQPLGKSLKQPSAFPIQQSSNYSTTNNVPAASKPSSNGNSYIAQKIHMTNKVNLVTTVKTENGLKITGRDSGGYARPSSSGSAPTKPDFSSDIRKRL